MRRFTNISIIVTLVSFVMFSFRPAASLPLTPQIEGGLAVIANPKGAPAEIAKARLKSLLKGEQQRWKDGTKILLAFMKTSTKIGEDMTTRIFGMTGKDLNKYFLAQVFQGKMSSPEFFDSEEDLINYVKSKDGAIGVISAKNASGSVVVSIDGKKSI
ncbi:MAG: hypothetical protein ACHQF2_05910 [Flavobacteriales bacterium]